MLLEEGPTESLSAGLEAGDSELLQGAGLRPALEGLFALWRESYADLEGATPCSRARSGRLACLLGQDGWSGLRNLNRPALITLQSAEGENVHALVTGFFEDRIQLEIAGKRYDSRQASLAPYWSGEYLMLWRPPGAFRRVMRKGLKGPDVYWLRLRLTGAPALHSNEGVEDPRHDLFDAQLHEAVVAFQKRRGLDPNGIVDARTLLHLNSIDPTSGVPLLAADKT